MFVVLLTGNTACVVPCYAIIFVCDREHTKSSMPQPKSKSVSPTKRRQSIASTTQRRRNSQVSQRPGIRQLSPKKRRQSAHMGAPQHHSLSQAPQARRRSSAVGGTSRKSRRSSITNKRAIPIEDMQAVFRAADSGGGGRGADAGSGGSKPPPNWRPNNRRQVLAPLKTMPTAAPTASLRPQALGELRL